MVSKVKLVSVLACFVSVGSLAENWKVLPDEIVVWTQFSRQFLAP
ncbi:MAG: hypothetical protein ACI8Q3_000293 [Marinomonas primoryensis]|jgi:hypothetical protein